MMFACFFLLFSRCFKNKNCILHFGKASSCKPQAASRETSGISRRTNVLYIASREEPRSSWPILPPYTKAYSFYYAYRTLYLLKTGFAKKPKNPV